MTKMLTSFVDIFGTSAGALREPYATQFKHYITIPNNARPLWIRQRRLAPAETTYLKKYIQQLQAIDAIEPTTSPWNSQVILVKKKGAAAGDFRVTVNMKPLNRLLKPQNFPMPNIVDIFDKMGNAQYFTTLDCTQGYYHIPLAEECRDFTAFSTPDGHWRYKVLPMGIQSAPAAWQSFMSSFFGHESSSSVHGRCYHRFIHVRRALSNANASAGTLSSSRGQAEPSKMPFWANGGKISGTHCLTQRH